MIWQIFDEHYLQAQSPFRLLDFETQPVSEQTEQEQVTASIRYKNVEQTISEVGNGPISAFVNAIRSHYDVQFTLADFGQNTRSSTSKAEAAAYVELKDADGVSHYGAGIDTSITKAPIKAIISALNRLIEANEK